MPNPSTVDVLIVGAGPTGLMLANQLARHGVAAMIIDRHAGPSLQTRALGVQARTLEIYSQLGIAQRAVALGRRTDGVNMWAAGRRTARIPLADIGRELSPFPFLLILGQDDNEALLGEALRKHAMDVNWGTELTALEQSVDSVRATLKRTDGSTRDVHARWIAGCDGAHSAVRGLNGIGFPGEPYEHVFFVADTVASGPMVPIELNVFLFRDGFHLFFPMRSTDHWRIVGILPPELRARNDVEFREVEASIREHVGGTLAFRECRWFSAYRIHHRRAERFRDRRCFLLGDAAHIHSPMGAQGMNTGLQDAYNLGWKLGLVCAGLASDSLLDSYHAERLPVAERLLRTTDRAFSVVVSDGWTSRVLRTRVLARVAAFAMRFRRAQRFAFRTVSQIGIAYRDSPLSATPTGIPDDAPRAGDRFPWLQVSFAAGTAAEDLFARLDDTRFNLIVVGQPALLETATGFDSHIRTLQIPAEGANAHELTRARIPVPSFFLLRPDGHIGLTGSQLDAATLKRYLVERIGMTPQSGASVTT